METGSSLTRSNRTPQAGRPPRVSDPLPVTTLEITSESDRPESVWTDGGEDPRQAEGLTPAETRLVEGESSPQFKRHQ